MKHTIGYRKHPTAGKSKLAITQWSLSKQEGLSVNVDGKSQKNASCQAEFIHQAPHQNNHHPLPLTANTFSISKTPWVNISEMNFNFSGGY